MGAPKGVLAFDTPWHGMDAGWCSSIGKLLPHLNAKNAAGNEIEKTGRPPSVVGRVTPCAPRLPTNAPFFPTSPSQPVADQVFPIFPGVLRYFQWNRAAAIRCRGWSRGAHAPPRAAVDASSTAPTRAFARGSRLAGNHNFAVSPDHGLLLLPRGYLISTFLTPVKAASAGTMAMAPFVDATRATKALASSARLGS